MLKEEKVFYSDVIHEGEFVEGKMHGHWMHDQGDGWYNEIYYDDGYARKGVNHWRDSDGNDHADEWSFE